MSKKMKKDTCTIKKGFKNNNGIVKSISHTINNKKKCNISIAHVKVKRNKKSTLANNTSERQMKLVLINGAVSLNKRFNFLFISLVPWCLFPKF